MLNNMSTVNFGLITVVKIIIVIVFLFLFVSFPLRCDFFMCTIAILSVPGIYRNIPYSLTSLIVSVSTSIELPFNGLLE